MMDSLQYVIYIINLYLCLFKETKGKGRGEGESKGESGHLQSLVLRAQKGDTS